MLLVKKAKIIRVVSLTNVHIFNTAFWRLGRMLKHIKAFYTGVICVKIIIL